MPLLTGLPDPFASMFLNSMFQPSPKQSVDPSAVGYEPAQGRPTAGEPGGPPLANTHPVMGDPPKPGAAAAGGVRGQGAPVTASGTPVGSGRMPEDPVAGGALRFPTDNPQFALQSALINRGVNPFRANPYMGMLMGRAPGLAQAFMLNNLGTSAGDMASQGGEGAMFGAFLESLLGQSGGMTGALGASANDLPWALNQITGLQDSVAGGGGSFQTTNPFAYALSQIYDDPQGSAGAYGALLSPFMSRGVGSAFQTGLGQVAGMGQRRLAGDVERGGEVNNFWDYLFPQI